MLGPGNNHTPHATESLHKTDRSQSEEDWPSGSESFWRPMLQKLYLKREGLRVEVEEELPRRGYFMLALRAISHDFAGGGTPSCSAKNDSKPGESNEKPVCLDLSLGSCAIWILLRSSADNGGPSSIAIISVCRSGSSASDKWRYLVSSCTIWKSYGKNHRCTL